MTKTVSFDVIDWPSNWETLSQISCLALGKTFPKESDIPDDVNPRGAKTTNKIYKDIVHTLIMEPEKFHEVNEGVTLYATVDAVEKQETFTRVFLSFNPKPEGENNLLTQGHADGRHTMLALHDTQCRRAGVKWDKVKVRLTIKRWQPTKDDKKSTVIKQRSYTIDKKTFYDASDEFALLKYYIPKTWKICYYQNQPETSADPRCDVGHILQTVGMLSPEFFWLNKNSTRFPIKFATNAGAQYDKMLENAETLGEIIPDIAFLENLFWRVVKNEYMTTAKPVPKFKYGNDEVIMHPNPEYIITGIDAPRSLVFPVLSAFRLFIYKGKNHYQWSIPMEEEYILPLMKQLWSLHKKQLNNWVETHINSPIQALVQDSNHWHELHSTANIFLQEKVGSSKVKSIRKVS